MHNLSLLILHDLYFPWWAVVLYWALIIVAVGGTLMVIARVIRLAAGSNSEAPAGRMLVIALVGGGALGLSLGIAKRDPQRGVVVALLVALMILAAELLVWFAWSVFRRIRSRLAQRA